MTAEELKVLIIVWNWGGEASIDIISREAKISVDYTRLICRSLAREGYIDFLHAKLCKIKSKGKMAIAGKRGQNPQKVVIPTGKSAFGLGKDKRGRLLLNY